MNKKILKQYLDLQEEIKDIEKKLSIMEKTTVTDSVKTSGSFPYSVHNCIIEGIDNKMYHIYKRKLKIRLEKSIALKKQILDFIHSIEEPQIRRIFTYRYINGFTWVKIQVEMGFNHEDTPRKRHDKFLKNML